MHNRRSVLRLGMAGAIGFAARGEGWAQAITLYGGGDGLGRAAAENSGERTQFPKLVARRVIEGAGHFLPREKPDAVAEALLELLRMVQ